LVVPLVEAFADVVLDVLVELLVLAIGVGRSTGRVVVTVRGGVVVATVVLEGAVVAVAVLSAMQSMWTALAA